MALSVDLHVIPLLPENRIQTRCSFTRPHTENQSSNTRRGKMADPRKNLYCGPCDYKTLVKLVDIVHSTYSAPIGSFIQFNTWAPIIMQSVDQLLYKTLPTTPVLDMRNSLGWFCFHIDQHMHFLLVYIQFYDALKCVFKTKLCRSIIPASHISSVHCCNIKIRLCTTVIQPAVHSVTIQTKSGCRNNMIFPV